MRICSQCREHKELTEFPKNSNKSGYRYNCKACDKKRRAIYHENNKESIRIKARDNARNFTKDKIDNINKLRSKRRLNNLDRFKAIDKANYEKYKPMYMAKAAKRNADKLNATPSWANLNYIKLFYKGAK